MSGATTNTPVWPLGVQIAFALPSGVAKEKEFGAFDASSCGRPRSGLRWTGSLAPLRRINVSVLSPQKSP